jgi:hypothetical protein
MIKEKEILNIDNEETENYIKLQSIIDLEKERLNSKNNIFTIKKRRFINVKAT